MNSKRNRERKENNRDRADTGNLTSSSMAVVQAVSLRRKDAQTEETQKKELGDLQRRKGNYHRNP